MYCHHICSPINNTLGPGNRLVLWASGCPRKCLGCISPELQELHSGFDISVDNLADLISPQLSGLDGITVSGGDPFFQPEELRKFVSLIKHQCDDILIYTGYLLSEIDKKALEGITAIIDGPYIAEQATDGILPYGSYNQRLHVFDTRYKPTYTKWLNSYEAKIQTFSSHNGIYSVGIHRV